jgi:hypothetical protein
MSDTRISYRTYIEEFKLEALELLKRGEKSSAQIERYLGRTTGLLLKMVRPLSGESKEWAGCPIGLE